MAEGLSLRRPLVPIIVVVAALLLLFAIIAHEERGWIPSIEIALTWFLRALAIVFAVVGLLLIILATQAVKSPRHVGPTLVPGIVCVLSGAALFGLGTWAPFAGLGLIGIAAVWRAGSPD